jgi:hypothetical protein
MTTNAPEAFGEYAICPGWIRRCPVACFEAGIGLIPGTELEVYDATYLIRFGRIRIIRFSPEAKNVLLITTTLAA